MNKQIKNMVKKLYVKALKIWLSVASRNSFFTKLHFLFINDFRLEQKGVLSGINRFNDELYKPQSSKFQLRRDIHRLEKGLIMKKRRDIFGLEYIDEAVNLYNVAYENKDEFDFNELKWAHDVLEQYFNIVSKNGKLNNLYNSFCEHRILNGNSASKYVPVIRSKFTDPIPNYENLLNLAKKRRSVRWYKQEKVPHDLIDKAIEVALLAPSACNRQPFEFRVFDDYELIQKLGNIPMGTKGFVENFPCLIVVVGKLNAYFDARDRHLIYIDAALAAMSFILALETLGLSSCVINWPSIESKDVEIKKLLNLNEDEKVTFLISLGYADPDGFIPYSAKKTLNQIRNFNRCL